MPIPAALSEQVTKINFDIEVKHVKDYLLTVCAEHGLRTDVAMAAFAEVVGNTAAQLDEKEGTDSLQERMHEFCKRVEVSYRKRR